MISVPRAIIGGTGVGSRLAKLGGRPLLVPTPTGPLRGRIVDLDSGLCLLVQRHSVGHKVPPHRVGYRGIALGLAALGVKACFASAAVGSLRPDWPAGTLVVPSDFLDLTARNLTLFDRDVVHTDFSSPLPARTFLLEASNKTGIATVDGGVYVCGNGPRYETPHEIEVYGRVGDLVGMTASTEAIVLREAGIDYGLLSVVTNLACGIADQPLSHEEVVEEMERSGDRAVAILTAAANMVL